MALASTVVLRALRCDAVVLASTTLREREREKTPQQRQSTGNIGKGNGEVASVLVESTKVFTEPLQNWSPPETPPDPSGSDNPYDDLNSQPQGGRGLDNATWSKARKIRRPFLYRT
ncbi:hypothetical protein F5888DRAFT_1633074 [Russula emetica]|nr:hypothetical protein F5888DRAFT_1633074 [Russula emetica]